MGVQATSPDQIRQRLFNPQQNPLYPNPAPPQPGAPPDFPGAVLPNPDNRQPQLDTAPPPPTRLSDGASFSHPNASGPPPMDTSNPPMNQMGQPAMREVGTEPPRGSIAQGMQQTSAPPANAPIAQAPQPFHHGKLASVLLGLGEVLGNPLATHIGERDRQRQQEVDEYQRNLPATQYTANVGAQKTAAELAKEAAQTEEAKSGVQRNQYEMGKEQQTAKANAISQIQQEVESGKYGDGTALLARWRRIAAANPHIGMTDEDIQGAISSTHPLGAKYQVQQDKNGRPEFATDREGNRLFPDAQGKFQDPELQSQWDSVSQTHQQALGEEEGKEKRVAGYAADRQAAGFAQAQKMEGVKATNDRVNTALDADERLSRMERSYQKAVKGDQQAMLALLTDHLGMTMGIQKGARITKDILNEAQNSQPWLQKIAARFNDNGVLSGAALGPEQMKQMLDLGYEARDRAYGSAHDAATTYGVPLPKGMENVERKRVVGGKPALESAGGQQHVPGGKAQGLQEGATGTGSDGKKYVVKGGVWIPR